ncbi:GGDEF domain-containing protein [Deinococcus sp.]|uniref:GGDEF domain-containing protein n=1 Tax=Deinococcus sp. TaxID=47478 RepID=UPI0025BF81FD|nr:GGDEF domain-containing protein [Deinococcus sp.]
MSYRMIPKWTVPGVSLWLGALLLNGLLFTHHLDFDTYLSVILLSIFVSAAFDFTRAMAYVLVALMLTFGLAAYLHEFRLQVLNYTAFAALAINHLVYFGRRVRQSEARAKRAELMVQRDQETGLLTGAAGVAQLKELLAQRELGPSRVGIVLLSPQGLKTVQEHYGYSSVQHFMQVFALRLVQLCGPQDVICRWQDQVFLVGLRNVNRAELLGRAEQLQAAVSGVFWAGGPMIESASAAVMVCENKNLTETLSLLEERLKSEKTSRD